MSDKTTASEKLSKDVVGPVVVHGPELPRGIPVHLARFNRHIQIPGKQSDDHAKTETLPNGRRWEVEYIPQIRHLKITFSDPARQKHGPEVGYVHESNVLCWWPAAL